MNTAHRIRLYPNVQQEKHLVESCGVARFAYNWAIGESERICQETGKRPSHYELRRLLNAIKRKQFPWMLGVSKCCPMEAITNFGKAWERCYKKLGKPPRKKKKFVNDSFTISMDDGAIKLSDVHIRLPKCTPIRLAEQFRYPNAKITYATISRKADKWFVSIRCQTQDKQMLSKTNKTIGVDVGVREYADSDGNLYPVPRSYRSGQRRLRRLQQSVSRKVKGSSNRRKAVVKVARQHLRISDVRNNWLHNLTIKLVRENDTIAIEDLNVKGMLKNCRLAKSISDASFGEFRRQLEYKCQWYGRTLVVADRHFPSSKTCSGCGAKAKRMPLHVRGWGCDNCGAQHHRDINAAVNLKNLAANSAVSACGEFSPLLGCQSDVQLSTSTKQELSDKPQPLVAERR